MRFLGHTTHKRQNKNAQTKIFSMLQMVDNRNSDLLNGLHQVSFKITPLSRGLNSLTKNPIYYTNNRYKGKSTSNAPIDKSVLICYSNINNVSNKPNNTN
jgi:hypothetical protein